MGLIQSVIKFYLVVLILRTAMTRQELYFNQLGKLVGKLTDPLFEKVFKLTKKSVDRALPIFILAAAALDALVIFMIGGYNLPTAALSGLADIAGFLMLFYIVCVIVGSFAGNSNMSHYAMFFNRIASPWVKLTRTFLPIKTNAVIVPTLIVVFLVFTAINAVIILVYQTLPGSGGLYPAGAVSSALKGGLISLTGILDVFVWLLIIRALMSWVSPDPRNPVVQIVAALTDPIMQPFRRIIPPIGAIDISPMILIFVVYFIKMMITRLAGIAF
jgi:YggT family protein